MSNVKEAHWTREKVMNLLVDRGQEFELDRISRISFEKGQLKHTKCWKMVTRDLGEGKLIGMIHRSLEEIVGWLRRSDEAENKIHNLSLKRGVSVLHTIEKENRESVGSNGV